MATMQQVQDDYRLTTAEIFYHTYENPDDLQRLTWQDYDLAPDYPELRRFLTYWSRHIDGVVHSVRLGDEDAIQRKQQRGSVTHMPSLAVH